MLKLSLLYQHSTEALNARKEVKRWEQMQKQALQKNTRKGNRTAGPQSPENEAGARLESKEVNNTGPTSGVDAEGGLHFNAPKKFHEKCDN